MTIHLVADDPDIQKLCREIIAEAPELCRSAVLDLAPADHACSGADLDIWDFHPGMRLPPRATWNPLRQFFLVDSRDLPAFYEETAGAEVSVLFKPAGKAKLEALIRAAMSDGAAPLLRAERDEILQCLIQANVKLQEHDREQTAFLSRALNDFRAPLTAMTGYCGLLLNEPLGPLTDSQAEVLRRMQNSARRLSRMASSMVALSAGRRAERPPALQPGDIRECVQDALREIAPFADEKVISIETDLGPPAGALHFEPGQLQEAMINLLDNACRFTPRAGAIEIRGYPSFEERRRERPAIAPGHERRRRASRDPNGYRVDIRDSGAPIPEEALDRIFDGKTPSAGPRDRSGGGLGLAVSKMIIGEHEGRLWAENAESGAVFSFFLPARPAGLSMPRAADVAEEARTAGGRR